MLQRKEAQRHLSLMCYLVVRLVSQIFSGLSLGALPWSALPAC